MTRIDQAIQILRDGGLVAFPTETVYGLGADATNAAAVAKIFAAKGRPATNPLIVHVFDEEFAQRYVSHWPDTARRLAGRFWPGPLTLVLPKNELIPAITTAGGPTVALRSPNHPLARELLQAFQGAIAAPSANRSTRLSPTTADHVRQELGSAVDLILDGGSCRMGIESTVLDVSNDRPTILRPGSITRADIELEIGPVSSFSGAVDVAASAMSPGQHAIHYSPGAAAYRFGRAEGTGVARWISARPGAKLALLWIGGAAGFPPGVAAGRFARCVEAPADPVEYARTLYANLRSLDAAGVEAIFIEMPPDSEQWLAVRDRLMRGTRAVD